MAEQDSKSKGKAVARNTSETKSKPVATKPADASKTNKAPAAKSTTATKTVAKEKNPVKTTQTNHTTPTNHTTQTTQTKQTPQTTRTKQTPQTKQGFSGKVGGAVAAVKNWMDWRKALIIGVSVLVLLALILGLTFGLRSCGSSSNPVNNPYRYDNASFKTNTRVQYYAATKGTVDRYKPVEGIKDERNAFDTDLFAFSDENRYPKYGYTLSYVLGTTADKVAARTALIAESGYLCAWGTRGANSGGAQTPDKYTMMDKDGWLYQIQDGQRVHSLLWGTSENVPSNYRRLYKHTASQGLYLGDVSDSEKGIVKELTLRNRGYGSYSVTGLYAPAGEVIKIQISDADMNATGGLTVHIGQALYNGQVNNIWVGKNQMQRIPHLLNTLVINKTTADYDEKTGMWTGYIGSFVGGPIYIRNTAATFTTTISGGVPYSHFILGYTTQAEFEENAKSSAPYFDLEVWDRGVLHSGPKAYAASFSYEDLYKVAVLWDKVASVTTTGSNQGIVFLYDPFVAAGAAVAFPGRSSVNCPMDWMVSSLNYDSIVTSGSWGNFHEYHHNFQGYGVGNGGEVTNNGMTLVSYALFTKISAKRGIEGYGGQGLGGWNNYTSATWALNDILSLSRGGHPSNGAQGLALYSVLLHNFGADNYIKAKIQQQSKHYGESYAGYFRAWEAVTHNDMSYYFKDVLKGLTSEVAAKWHNTEYSSMFVPVASVYQTGRSYMYDGEKKYFQTMQPYVVPYEDTFTLDLSQYNAPGGQYASGSVMIPDGFTYTVKSIKPVNGSIEKLDDFHYKYKFADKNRFSGEIKVTLGITKTDGAFAVDDVDLVLELERSHEMNKLQLERTTYTYTADTVYTDAVAAYEANFAGYTGEPMSWTHSNPTQNSNTDIWLCTPSALSKFPQADPEKHVAKENTIEVLKGKLYFQEAGKYRIYLRGRVNCAAFITYTDKNGNTQNATIHITNGSGSGFYLNNPETYVDIEVGDHAFVSFTEVLIVKLINQNQASYVGLGYNKWTEPMFTIVEKHYDANNNEVDSPEADGYHHTVTHYYDYLGREVSEEAANNAQLIAPASAAYISGFRGDYELPDNSSFQSEYFYVRNYSYNYADNLWQNQEQTLVDTTYVKGTHYGNWETYKPDNLVDGDRNTFIHTGRAATTDKPFEFVVDMGEVKPINRMTVYTQYRGGNGDWLAPKDFVLYGSVDGVDYFTVGEFTDAPRNGTAITVDFEEKSFRYYKLVITRSDRLLIIAEIEMWRILEITGGKQIASDDAMFTYKGNWNGAQTLSNFGHVNVGTKGATVQFEFEGTRFGIFGSHAYGTDFEVKIDGKKVESFALKEDDFGVSLVFLSNLLNEGKHQVTIKCKGVSNIDSVVIFP